MNETFNAVQLAALFRTILQAGFSVVGWSNYVDDNLTLSAAAFLAALVTTVWGIWARNNKNLVADAANVPQVHKVIAEPTLAKAVPSDKVVPPPAHPVSGKVVLP